MKIDLKKVQHSLTPKQIIDIMVSLGVENYDDKPKYIIFPTICHNISSTEASMKLYYYKDTHLFHCYTECSDSFNIFELLKRVMSVRNYNNGDFNFSDVLDFFFKLTGIKDNESIQIKENVYTSIKDRYKRKQRTIELPVYSKQLQNMFVKMYPPEWKDEGIGEAAMDKFGICYSISQNKIIIPHYDINGELIGIRGRTLNPEEIEKYGKYMPVKIENTIYSHPLSQNLYGLNFSKEGINKTKKAVLFESEKSVLLYETFFEINNSVAVCGSNFNKVQLELLLKNTDVEEIIICFDKEYLTAGGAQGEKYFNKLRNICLKYSQYCNMSFVFDREQLLQPKDSPIDRGKDIFLHLYEKRIKC